MSCAAPAVLVRSPVWWVAQQIGMININGAKWMGGDEEKYKIIQCNVNKAHNHFLLQI